MKSKTTQQFRRPYEWLPSQVREQAREAYRLFKTNPAYPGLNFERIRGTQTPIY